MMTQLERVVLRVELERARALGTAQAEALFLAEAWLFMSEGFNEEEFEEEVFEEEEFGEEEEEFEEFGEEEEEEFGVFFRKQLTDLDLGTDPITIIIPEEAAIHLPPGDEQMNVFNIDGPALSFEIGTINGQLFLYCDGWPGFVSQLNLRRGETLVVYRGDPLGQQNAYTWVIES